MVFWRLQMGKVARRNAKGVFGLAGKRIIRLARPISPQRVSLNIFAWLVQRLRFSLNFHIVPKNYSSPIPDDSELEEDFWERQSEMHGIDMGETRALALMRDVFPRYLPEFRARFPNDEPADGKGFFLINGA